MARPHSLKLYKVFYKAGITQSVKMYTHNHTLYSWIHECKASVQGILCFNLAWQHYSEEKQQRNVSVAILHHALIQKRKEMFISIWRQTKLFWKNSIHWRFCMVGGKQMSHYICYQIFCLMCKSYGVKNVSLKKNH